VWQGFRHAWQKATIAARILVGVYLAVTPLSGLGTTSADEIHRSLWFNALLGLLIGDGAGLGVLALVKYRKLIPLLLVAALLGVAAFDFFFVPPYFSFAVADTQYVWRPCKSSLRRLDS
jgi:drug/metabolite transporter (DMT)-like permease